MVRDRLVGDVVVVGRPVLTAVDARADVVVGVDALFVLVADLAAVDDLVGLVASGGGEGREREDGCEE